MSDRTYRRVEWLAALSTRELVIFLMELGSLRERQPELAPDVDDACAVLRSELLRREWPAHVSP